MYIIYIYMQNCIWIENMLTNHWIFSVLVPYFRDFSSRLLDRKVRVGTVVSILPSVVQRGTTSSPLIDFLELCFITFMFWGFSNMGVSIEMAGLNCKIPLKWLGVPSIFGESSTLKAQWRCFLLLCGSLRQALGSSRLPGGRPRIPYRDPIDRINRRS